MVVAVAAAVAAAVAVAVVVAGGIIIIIACSFACAASRCSLHLALCSAQSLLTASVPDMETLRSDCATCTRTAAMLSSFSLNVSA